MVKPKPVSVRRLKPKGRIYMRSFFGAKPHVGDYTTINGHEYVIVLVVQKMPPSDHAYWVDLQLLDAPLDRP